MSPWVPPARLDPEIYRYWIDENPKKILGGQLRLVSNHNPPHFDDDVKLASHRIVTNVLSSPHADDLIIFGFPHKYRGFKIIVKNGGFLKTYPRAAPLYKEFIKLWLKSEVNRNPLR